MPQINWRGRDVDALEINFKGVREEIMRLQEEYDQEGNPVYVFKSTNVVTVKSPDNIKRS